MVKWYLLEEIKEVALAAGQNVKVGNIATMLTASGFYKVASTDTNGERVEGIFLDDADNVLGSDGDVSAKVGVGIVQLPATNAERTLVGTNACAISATNVSGSGGPVVGRIHEYVSPTALKVWVGKKA